MKLPHLLSGLCATVLTLLTFSVNAALVQRLGGLAYYDDEANLTWLADANYSYTNPDDTVEAYGPVNWQQANDWAANLNIAGVTGWRLPSALNEDGTDPCLRFNCSGGELGNMFYNVLGGVAGNSISTTHNSNYELFSNIVVNGAAYWYGTESATYVSSAWTFRFYDGSQRTFNKDYSYFYAWAVHDGDVSAVPVPAAIWLFGTGLIILFGIARKKAV